jgi:hypothetical protein
VTLPDAALAARPATCSACSGPLDPLGRCGQCGAVFGEAYRCPLCQAVSDVEADPVLYFRCRACGGPRIPPHSLAISEAEVGLLRPLRREQLRAAAFRAGFAFALASGVLSLLVTGVVLLATTPPAVATSAALLACMVPFALALFAFRRARRHAHERDAALSQVWLLAASRLSAQHGGRLSARALADELRIDEARAESLLAEASVQDFLHDPAELPARTRVTELADPSELAPAAEATQVQAGSSKPENF